MKFNDREEIISLTPLWRGERFADGRPKVAASYLEALRLSLIHICVYYGNEQAYKIYLGYFDAFADLSAEEVEKRYSRHFSLKHGSYDFLYCPATDGIVRSTAKAALSGLSLIHI